MRTALTRLPLLSLALMLAASGCDSEGGPTYSNQTVSVRYVSFAEFGQVRMTLLVADSGEASVDVEFGDRNGTHIPPEHRMGTLQPADLLRLKQAAVAVDLATLEGPFDCLHYTGCWADKPSGTLEITIDGITSSVIIDRNIPDDKLPDRLQAMLTQLDAVQKALPR